MNIYKQQVVESETEDVESVDQESEKNTSASSNANLAFEGFYLSKQMKNNHRIAVLAVSVDKSHDSKKPNKHAFMTIYRPNTGLQPKQESSESLLKKYKRVGFFFKSYFSFQYQKIL